MKTVMVLYGGVSPEHEIAIITGLQVMNALKEVGFEVIPGYVSKTGEWILGDGRFLKSESYKNLSKLVEMGRKQTINPGQENSLMVRTAFGYKKSKKIDVVFPVFHGKNGEDGAMAGLLNLMNLPYVGCQLTAGAVGIDKYLTKRIVHSLGVKVVDDILVTKNDWENNKEAIKDEIKKKLGEVVFVKPNSLGSSIGISKAKNGEELENAIEVALQYDQRVLVEKAVDKPTEINISILGNDPYQLSVTEEPVAADEVLSFEDKYLRSGSSKNKRTEGMAGAGRHMPARVEEKVIKEVEETAEKVFRALGGKGISRIDFMKDGGGNLFFNEINTMPGSVSFYLWEKSGLSFGQLVLRLVDLAQEEWQDRQKLVSAFESNVLASYSSNGAKGAKLKIGQ
jgi:D-alanine-D-alanine ligase